MTVERRAWPYVLLALALVAAGAILSYQTMAVAPAGIWNDDAAYVSLARAVVQSGHLYHVVSDARGGPFPFLPGYSFFLVPFVLVLPGSLLALRWVSVACMLTAAVLAAKVAWPRLGPAGAILLGAAFFFTRGTMIHGSSLLSDPFFALLLMALWALWPRVDTPGGWKAGLLMGLGTAWLTSTRPAGALLFGSAILLLGLHRHWRALLACTAGLALGTLPFLPYWLGYLTMHGEATAGQFSAWWAICPAQIGDELVGLGTGSWWAGAAALLLVVVSVAIQWRRVGLQLETVYLPLYLAHYVVWPYFSPRYLLPAWPMMLLVMAEALRPVPPAAFLALMLGFGSSGVARTVQESHNVAALSRDRFETYDWMRDHLGPHDLVEDMSGWRTLMLAGRPFAVPGRSIQFPSQLLVEACHDHAPYVLVERHSDLVRSVTGAASFDVPPRLDLWYECSSLLTSVHASRYDELFRVKVDPAKFVPAFQDFYVAVRSPDPVPGLRACLALVPDFPEARHALALQLWHRPAAPPPETLQLLQSVVEQYPVDVVSTLDLAQAEAATGHLDSARQMVEKAQDAVKRYELPYQAQVDTTRRELTPAGGG
ncbi:MAG TPA: hypothetical protein VGO93_10925 [Candidatus Xenobia bacterium]|jgi:hypothetical protein